MSLFSGTAVAGALLSQSKFLMTFQGWVLAGEVPPDVLLLADADKQKKDEKKRQAALTRSKELAAQTERPKKKKEQKDQECWLYGN